MTAKDQPSAAARTWQIVSGVLVAVVAGLLLYVVPAFVGIQTNLASIQTELVQLRREVAAAATGRWTDKDHAAYASMIDRQMEDFCRRLASIETTSRRNNP